MKILFSLLALLISRGIPYVLVLVRRRKELPPRWKSGLVILIGRKVHRSAYWLAVYIGYVLATLRYAIKRVYRPSHPNS